MTAAQIAAAIAFAVAANIIVWGSILYRPRRPRVPLVAPHAGRHAATERIHAGGRYLATQPRRNSPPLTEQAIITSRPGRPWETYPQPVLRQYDERHCAVPSAHGMTDPYYCTVPAHHYPPNDDAETLRLGDWGTMPAERIIAAEQLAKGLIA